jgi:hypothetical protein
MWRHAASPHGGVSADARAIAAPEDMGESLAPEGQISTTFVAPNARFSQTASVDNVA